MNNQAASSHKQCAWYNKAFTVCLDYAPYIQDTSGSFSFFFFFQNGRIQNVSSCGFDLTHIKATTNK